MSLLICPCLLLAFGPADTAPPSASGIPGLVQQLRSKRFREREAATKALERVGEPALEQLRKAAKDDADAEVRRRAGALVERLEYRLAPVRVRRIVKSKLRSAEKGRRLKCLIHPGMAVERVRELLGPPSPCMGCGWHTDSYFEFALGVSYSQDWRVQHVQLMEILRRAK
jgi:hypothetical protein